VLPASILVPTRDRAHYLEVTLASVVPQADRLGAEVIVINDGADGRTEAIAKRHETRLLTFAEPRGLNAARNAGIRAASSDVIVLIDDDIEAPPGWLESMLAGIAAAPDHEVFGGPIRARIEGGLRMCDDEDPPISALELGSADRDTEAVWGANMAIRRSAFERLGPFDETITGLRGDEEEWERRYTSAGGTIRYIARAGLDHRRDRTDSSVRALSRSAYRLGRAARRWDRRKAIAPPLRRELRTTVACLLHAVRRRCENGAIAAAYNFGRVREAIAAKP
jgi:glycosyltransferase involved in cell wall biosynthesis